MLRIELFIGIRSPDLLHSRPSLDCNHHHQQTCFLGDVKNSEVSTRTTTQVYSISAMFSAANRSLPATLLLLLQLASVAYSQSSSSDSITGSVTGTAISGSSTQSSSNASGNGSGSGSLSGTATSSAQWPSLSGIPTCGACVSKQSSFFVVLNVLLLLEIVTGCFQQGIAFANCSSVTEPDCYCGR